MGLALSCSRIPPVLLHKTLLDPPPPMLISCPKWATIVWTVIGLGSPVNVMGIKTSQPMQVSVMSRGVETNDKHRGELGHGTLQRSCVVRSEMTLNYPMIVERYPNQTKWLVVRFPAMESSLCLIEELARWSKTSHVFQKQERKKENHVLHGPHC